MSKVRNISGGPLDVPLLDRVVEADEIVEVPDIQPDGSPIVWPPNRWEAVTPGAASFLASAKTAEKPAKAAKE